MATTNTGSFTATIQDVSMRPDGSMTVSVLYTGTGQRVVATRYITIPANSANPIMDQFGQVIAAGGGWATLATEIQNFLTQLLTAFNGAAAGGKLDL